MKLIRCRLGGSIKYGILSASEVEFIEGDLFGGLARTGSAASAVEVDLLAPVCPSKVVALGLNYRDHAREMGVPVPEEPIIFLKPSATVIGPGDPIPYPYGGLTRRVDYEAELGIVIGRKARHVKAGEANDYILGFTCVNDVTARDLQVKDGQWSRAKGFDGFCPIGPWIETELDPANLRVMAVLNGKTVQDSTTRELIFDVPKIIEHISRVMTLFPGDVIATGTPPGIGPMEPGDEIVVSVEGVGELKNPVTAEKEPG